MKRHTVIFLARPFPDGEPVEDTEATSAGELEEEEPSLLDFTLIVGVRVTRRLVVFGVLVVCVLVNN